MLTKSSVNWRSTDAFVGIVVTGMPTLLTLSIILSFCCLEKMLYVRSVHFPLTFWIPCNGFICGGLLELTEVNLACAVNGTVPNLCPIATAGT